MSKRNSKYQLIFEVPSVIDMLEIQYKKHEKKWGVSPRKIYLPAKYYNQYRDFVPDIIKALNWEENTLYYKGAKVYEL